MYIGNIGMITAAGGNTRDTVMAVRTGLNTYSESTIFGRAFKPLKLALIPDLAMPTLNDTLKKAGLCQRYERIIRSVSVALRQCVNDKVNVQSMPMFLSLPESLPGRSSEVPSFICEAVIRQSGIEFDANQSKLVHFGRSGGLYALAEAKKYLDSSGADFALIAGVDSPLDHKWLAYMDFKKRVLHSSSKYGFAPGEAACVLLVTSEKGCKRLGLNQVCLIDTPQIAEEKGHIYSDQPYKGDGLSAAFKLALDKAMKPLAPIKHVYTSMNGEQSTAKELGVAMVRNSQLISEHAEIHHVADCLGDIGAASSVFNSGLAAYELMTGNIDGPALIYGSSDHESRCAGILRLL